MKIKRILLFFLLPISVGSFQLNAQPGAETAALAKIEATLQESKLLQYMNLSVNQGVMKTAKDAVNYGVNTVKAIQLSNEILEMTNSLICQQDELYTLVSIPGVADDCLTGIKLNSMIADLTFSNGVMKKIILSSNLMQMDIKADGIVAMLEKVKSTLQKTIKDVEDLNRELTVEFWVNYVRSYQFDEINYVVQKQAAYSQSLDRLMQAEEKRRVSLGLTELKSISEGSRATKPQIVTGGQEDVKKGASEIKKKTKISAGKTKNLVIKIISTLLVLGMITSIWLVVSNSPKAKTAVISFLVALIVASLGISLLSNVI